MAAFNVVRMRVKPGREADFLELYKSMDEETIRRMKENGLRRRVVIKTGERSYCLIAEWESKESIHKSIPYMIANLDRGRDLLEDLGGGLGVTDPSRARSSTSSFSGRARPVLSSKTPTGRAPAVTPTVHARS